MSQDINFEDEWAQGLEYPEPLELDYQEGLEILAEDGVPEELRMALLHALRDFLIMLMNAGIDLQNIPNLSEKFFGFSSADSGKMLEINDPQKPENDNVQPDKEKGTGHDS